MTDSNSEKTRMLLRDLLVLISDAEAQQRYEREVPSANVPAELVCMWFDDQYQPEAEWFAECFSEHERALMADFDDFYDGLVDSLPASGGVAKLHASESWLAVMDKARATLAALGWSP